MKITICIGSSCHVHGSRPVVEQIQQLVEDNGLQDKVELLHSELYRLRIPVVICFEGWDAAG